MAELFTPAKQESETRNWMPFVVGLVAVVVVIGAIILFTRNTGKTTQQVNPYVAKLQISNAKVSAEKRNKMAKANVVLRMKNSIKGVSKRKG